jgi:uncharacterized membrane protein YidH (DUF202 family)
MLSGWKTAGFVLLFFAGTASAQHILPVGLTEASIQDVTIIIASVAVGLGVLMIGLHGVRWMLADNDEERHEARQGVINVSIGLLLVAFAAAVVALAFSAPSYT